MTAQVTFQHLSKSFGNVCANRDVSFEVQPQTIHGIVGENGAGKSTVVKMLYGMYRPDSGNILVRGERREFSSPQDAIALGVGMVHQHFMLVPTLSVWQNVILGREPGCRLRCEEILAHLNRLQKEYGFDLDLHAPVESLAVGFQQQVEILKLLYRESTTLILDEPTAVLTPQEVERLFERLRTLRASGKTILLISHKLKEILSFTETVTIMRQGTVVETCPTGDLSEAALAEKIIGRARAALPARTIHPRTEKPLEVHGLSLGNKCGATVDLDVHKGEIVGIAGVEGNGQQALIEAIALGTGGAHVKVLGKPCGDLYALKQEGFAVLPPDRLQEAVIPSFTAAENSILGHHREARFSRRGWLQPDRIGKEVQALMARFDVRPPRPELPISSFSGGNQQKMVVGRELASGARFLLAAHPTRGVDIGAIDAIHAEFVRMREAGAGILVISSELDEILSLSDRILVLFEGKIQGEARRGQISERELGLWMTGGSP